MASAMGSNPSITQAAAALGQSTHTVVCSLYALLLHRCDNEELGQRTAGCRFTTTL
jgi:hypothetical protein